jgi:hypothetical protein
MEMEPSYFASLFAMIRKSKHRVVQITVAQRFYYVRSVSYIGCLSVLGNGIEEGFPVLSQETTKLIV